MTKASISLMKWILIFFIVSIFIFGIVRFLPVTPAEMLLFSYNLPQTEENIKNLEVEWGLDKPIIYQYINWIVHFTQGDWGISYMTKRSVKEEMLSRAPYSLVVGLGGIIISAILSILLGYLASLKENGVWDKITRLMSLICQTVPAFIFSIIIVYFLGVKLKLVKFFTGNGVASILIATLMVSFYSLGSLSRVVRSHFREIMNETYIVFAISRGFSPGYVLFRHGIKPVLYGLISTLISKFSWAIGGTAVVEFVFGIPGLSNFLVESIRYRDYNVIQSYILFIAIWMFVVHVTLNGVLRILDVRMRK